MGEGRGGQSSVQLGATGQLLALPGASACRGTGDTGMESSTLQGPIPTRDP